jgi:hypothetical protein
MTNHKTGKRKEWLAARLELLEAEKELTRRSDELAHRRLAIRGNMVGVSGGWHIHLAILTDILNGIPPRPFWSNHAILEAEYEKRIPTDVKTT